MRGRATLVNGLQLARHEAQILPCRKCRQSSDAYFLSLVPHILNNLSMYDSKAESLQPIGDEVYWTGRCLYRQPLKSRVGILISTAIEPLPSFAISLQRHDYQI
jgi:hypothetical protein